MPKQILFQYESLWGSSEMGPPGQGPISDLSSVTNYFQIICLWIRTKCDLNVEQETCTVARALLSSHEEVCDSLE